MWIGLEKMLTEVEKSFDLGHGVLSHYEVGRHIPTPDLITKLAELYQTDEVNLQHLRLNAERTAVKNNWRFKKIGKIKPRRKAKWTPKMKKAQSNRATQYWQGRHKNSSETQPGFNVQWPFSWCRQEVDLPRIENYSLIGVQVKPLEEILVLKYAQKAVEVQHGTSQNNREYI